MDTIDDSGGHEFVSLGVPRLHHGVRAFSHPKVVPLEEQSLLQNPGPAQEHRVKVRGGARAMFCRPRVRPLPITKGFGAHSHNKVARCRHLLGPRVQIARAIFAKRFLVNTSSDVPQPKDSTCDGYTLDVVLMMFAHVRSEYSFSPWNASWCWMHGDAELDESLSTLLCLLVVSKAETHKAVASWHNGVSRVWCVPKPTTRVGCSGLVVLRGDFAFLNRDFKHLWSNPKKILKPFHPILSTILAKLTYEDPGL